MKSGNSKRRPSKIQARWAKGDDTLRLNTKPVLLDPVDKRRAEIWDMLLAADPKLDLVIAVKVVADILAAENSGVNHAL